MKWTDPDTGKKYSLYPTEELAQDLQEFQASACEHKRKEFREARNRVGTPHVRSQCLDCGELVGSAIPRAKAPANIKEADEDLRISVIRQREEYLKTIYRKHLRQQSEEGESFKAQYAEYLASADWQKKRAKVLQRAGGNCEGCRERPPTQVHHLTYEHWRDELLFELVALCDVCHRKCHPDELESWIILNGDSER